MSADADRRDQAWLRLECSDEEFARAFRAAKLQLDARDPANSPALIALGAEPGTLLEPLAGDDIITSFVFGRLGYAPDGEKERLRLRPDFPSEWTHATIENIRVGDAFVKLEYERTHNSITYKLSQPGGPYPIRLILEAVIDQPIAKARVDGKEAQLDLIARGEKVMVPVQIMLDDERIIELVIG